MELELVLKAIPFNKPYQSGNELSNVKDAIARGHISGDGHYTRLSSKALEARTQAGKILLTTSCTHALELSALLLGIEPGDEVIVPSFTFVSTVNAFVLRGAVPVFCDIREDTLNLDENKLPSLFTPKTRVIVPVHYAGVSCEMDSILKLAGQRNVAVVEDAAHALGGLYKGRPLGSLGLFGAFSFHETKNYSCGEGGALALNDQAFVARAEILREKGTNRSQFFRGEVDKYSWVDLGSSLLPSDMLAAFLLAQLEQFEEIRALRKRIWQHYDVSLKSWCQRHGIRQPFIPDDCDQAFHMYYLIFPSEQIRDRFNAEMKADGIGCIFHYTPLHSSSMGQRFGGRPGQCAVTEEVSACLTRLPFYNGLTVAEQDQVIESILSFKM